LAAWWIGVGQNDPGHPGVALIRRWSGSASDSSGSISCCLVVYILPMAVRENLASAVVVTGAN
jgi:hypothetical protein